MDKLPSSGNAPAAALRAHPELTPEEIAAIARASGLALKPEHLADLVDAYAHLRAILERLPREFDYAAEPAHVFDARKFSQQREKS